MKDLLDHLRAMLLPVMTPPDDYHAVIADGYRLHDLEPYQSWPRRFRGLFQTRWPEQWASYLGMHAGRPLAVVFVNSDARQAVAVLDYAQDLDDAEGIAAWGQHRATLALEPTPIYRALCDNLRTAQSGEAIADLLLDWPELIPVNDGNEQTRVNAVHELRNLKTNHQIDAEETRTETSQGASLAERHQLRSSPPTSLVLDAPLYDGLPSMAVSVRLRYHFADKHPRVSLRIDGQDRLERTIADAFAALIADLISARAELSHTRVLIGTWQSQQPTAAYA